MSKMFSGWDSTTASRIGGGVWSGSRARSGAAIFPSLTSATYGVGPQVAWKLRALETVSKLLGWWWKGGSFCPVGRCVESVGVVLAVGTVFGGRARGSYLLSTLETETPMYALPSSACCKPRTCLQAFQALAHLEEGRHYTSSQRQSLD